MNIGEVFGNYRVIEVSEKTYTIKLFGIKHPKEFNYLLCECTECGAEAALAYDRAAIALHGEFALLNNALNIKKAG